MPYNAARYIIRRTKAMRWNRRIRRRFRSMRRRGLRIPKRPRAARPEIKYIDKVNASVSFDATTNSTVNLSTTAIAQGTDYFNMIGRKCQFRWATGFVSVSGPRITTAANMPTVTEEYVRFIFWVPRTDNTSAQTYMASVTSPSTVIDYYYVTVLKDKWMRLSACWANPTGAAPSYPNSATPNKTQFKFTLKFKRNIEGPVPSAGTINLNADKDIIYMTAITGWSSAYPCLFTSRCRVTFVDS